MVVIVVIVVPRSSIPYEPKVRKSDRETFRASEGDLILVLSSFRAYLGSTGFAGTKKHAEITLRRSWSLLFPSWRCLIAGISSLFPCKTGDD